MEKNRTSFPDLIQTKDSWTSIQSGDIKKAIEIAERFRQAELRTVGKSPEGRTESDVGTLIIYAVENGIDVPLTEVDPRLVSSVMKLSNWSKFKRKLQFLFIPREINKSYNRLEFLKEVIKNREDFDKLPPIVISRESNGKYELFDGQTRTFLAQRMGLKKIKAYLLPNEFHEGSIKPEARLKYRQLITKFSK